MLISGVSKLVIVSNRLPVRIEANGSASRTEGGLASALEGANLELEQLWVGRPGGAVEDFDDVERVTGDLRRIGVEPVFLTRNEVDGFTRDTRIRRVGR